MLQADELCYEFNNQAILAHCSLSAEPGMCVHVRGPNGAGKSTLLKILTGLLQPFSGRVFWQGEDIVFQRAHYHQQLAYLGHKPAVKALLTVAEQLNHTYNETSDILGLNEIAAKMGYELSAGQKQRVALARILSGDAKLWVLDEPYTALDQAGISLVSQRFAQHCQQGGLIVLTSHQSVNLDNTDVSDFSLATQEVL